MRKHMDKVIITALLGILAGFAALLGSFGGSYVAAPSETSFGAIPGSDIPSEQWSAGGVQRYSFQRQMIATTSNVCSIKTPNATTTFKTANAGTRMTVANEVGSTITKLGIFLGANNFATTTLIAQESQGAGNNIEVSATTTWTTAAGAVINAPHLLNKLIPPNSFVNFGIQGT